MNPYNETSIEYKIYEEQINYNIPMLLLICNKIDEILINENRNTVLFTSRDGCLLIKLFSHLYPQYKSIYFHSSRVINTNYTDDYISYLKDIYNKDSCIIFDLHGSFYSGRNMFIKTFGHLPRVFIFDISNMNYYYDGITYISNNSNYVIEELNQDYKGTLLQFVNNTDIRSPTENSVKYIDVMHITIESFIQFFDINLKQNAILYNTDFFVKYYYKLIISEYKSILPNEYTTKSITTLCNQYNSDKGNQVGCKHNYSIKYEQIINDILNFKLHKKDYSVFDLLEIGLNRVNTKSVPSLMVWNDFFNKNINITGFDINNCFLNFKSENIDIKIGDQSNEYDLLQLKNKNYDIIIDDGYHMSKHQQITFKTLWSNIKPGGYFIIEDLHYQPEEECVIKTKTLFENWQNGNWIETEYINYVEIQQIKNDIESINFYDSQSTFWGDSVKNAFVYIKKRILTISGPNF